MFILKQQVQLCKDQSLAGMTTKGTTTGEGICAVSCLSRTFGDGMPRDQSVLKDGEAPLAVRHLILCLFASYSFLIS